MKIRHTVAFTFYEATTRDQIDEVINKLNNMGGWLTENMGVTNWVVSEHLPETFKRGRAHLLQDGVFPDIESLNKHAESDIHKKVLELTSKVSDWMTIDTVARD